MKNKEARKNDGDQPSTQKRVRKKDKKWDKRKIESVRESERWL